MSQAESNPNIIELDVGGTHMKTLKSTLLKVEYFKKIYDRWNGKDQLFIDADPNLFIHILNKLRDDKYILPDDPNLQQMLDYYQCFKKVEVKSSVALKTNDETSKYIIGSLTVPDGPYFNLIKSTLHYKFVCITIYINDLTVFNVQQPLFKVTDSNNNDSGKIILYADTHNYLCYFDVTCIPNSHIGLKLKKEIIGVLDKMEIKPHDGFFVKCLLPSDNYTMTIAYY